MKNRARVGALAACMTLLCTGGAAFLQGCGGDDTIVDAGKADAAEAGKDVTTSDAPDDVVVPADADADAGPSFDGGCLDGSAVTQFQTDMIKAVCGRFSTCCFADAATFDETACEALVAAGWENSAQELGPADHCKMVLNANTATSCLAGLKTFSCPSMAPSEYSNITQNCFGAVSGSVAVGGVCQRHVECQKGNYCAPLADGGNGGTCQPIGSQGASCDKINGTVVNENNVCAYRGHVNETLYCDRSRAPDAGAATKQCQPMLANGKPCINSWDCASGLCGDDGTCGSVVTMTDPVFRCSVFKKDGG